MRGNEGQPRAGAGSLEVKGWIQALTVTSQGQRRERDGGGLVLGVSCLPRLVLIRSLVTLPPQSILAAPLLYPSPTLTGTRVLLPASILPFGDTRYHPVASLLPLKAPGKCYWSSAGCPSSSNREAGLNALTGRSSLFTRVQGYNVNFGVRLTTSGS